MLIDSTTLPEIGKSWLNWLGESGGHLKECTICLSFTTGSMSHRLARMELLH